MTLYERKKEVEKSTVINYTLAYAYLCTKIIVITHCPKSKDVSGEIL